MSCLKSRKEGNQTSTTTWKMLWRRKEMQQQKRQHQAKCKAKWPDSVLLQMIQNQILLYVLMCRCVCVTFFILAVNAFTPSSVSLVQCTSVYDNYKTVYALFNESQTFRQCSLFLNEHIFQYQIGLCYCHHKNLREREEGAGEQSLIQSWIDINVATGFLPLFFSALPPCSNIVSFIIVKIYLMYT